MSFLVSDVVAQVKLLCGETTERWADVAVKIPWYNSAVRRIRSDRPDTKFHPDSGNLVDYVAATAVTDASILDDIWQEALVFYIAGMCLTQDGEDERDVSRGKDYLAQFEDLLKR